MSTQTTELSLAPSALPRGLGVLAVFLLAASVTGQIARIGFGHDHVKGFVPLFNVDAEQNIPTYFSILLLLIAASLLTVTAVLEARGARPWFPWALLSFGFLVMGYDEAFRVHEQLVIPMRQLLGGSRLGLFSFAWVVPGLVLVGFLALVFLKFLLRLPAPTKRRFLLAAALYLGGAIGLEMVGGWVDQAYGSDGWPYAVAATIEEGMEMAGLILFVRALLYRWADSSTAIQVRFAKS